jgi:hypothetical protein
MAAAALVTLAGGTRDQAVAAASMALQSMLGLICDPIANRVEAPCLGKNVMAASNALSCANMALADFDPLIPLDEVDRCRKGGGRKDAARAPLHRTGRPVRDADLAQDRSQARGPERLRLPEVFVKPSRAIHTFLALIAIDEKRAVVNQRRPFLDSKRKDHANAGHHYLGCAKSFARTGQAFAEAILRMEGTP